MKFLSRLQNRFHIFFRNYYERRVSLPWGITRFVANVAFIQLTHEECIVLAPVEKFASAWVTTTGVRPLLNYAVWLDAKGKWQHVQVIIEIDRGFQIHNETFESETARMEILEANSKALKKEELKPVPLPVFYSDDWELATLEDPRLEPLKDIFLGFAFYAPFTRLMKQRVEAPSV